MKNFYSAVFEKIEKIEKIEFFGIFFGMVATLKKGHIQKIKKNVSSDNRKTAKSKIWSKSAQ